MCQFERWPIYISLKEKRSCAWIRYSINLYCLKTSSSCLSKCYIKYYLDKYTVFSEKEDLRKNRKIEHLSRYACFFPSMMIIYYEMMAKIMRNYAMLEKYSIPMYKRFQSVIPI